MLHVERFHPLVMDAIDGIGFARFGIDVKGDIFKYLLPHPGQSALNAQFRTPSQIKNYDGQNGGPKPRSFRLKFNLGEDRLSTLFICPVFRVHYRMHPASRG